MFDLIIPKIYKEINSDNYLINCYKHLIRSKVIHFFFILIEILLNIFQEIETFIKDFDTEKKTNDVKFFSFIEQLYKIPVIAKIIILLFFIIVFDLLYIFLGKKNYRNKFTVTSIILNFLEIFYFRTIMIILFDLFFSLDHVLFLVSCLFLIPHIYFIINNFLYNHLYYFVPKFIKYPYDEFSYLFDIILLFIKVLLSVSGNTNNYSLGHFCFIIIILIQSFFSFYFIYLLNCHSYLFMKNTFLNKTRLSFFFSMTFILVLALLFGENEVISPLFLIISLGVFFIILTYIYLIYNPFHYVKIKRETPKENIFFYLFILSNENDLDFLFENKINEHFEICGICNLCKKYALYLNINENNEENDEEEEKLINKKKNNNNNKLIDLFDIIYDGKNKYFDLIKKIALNYKIQGEEFFNNNSHYYINLSFLIYSDYQKNNINLSLNEKILLEVINRDNKLLDNHESQINKIILCNKFIFLSNKVLKQLKEILNCEQRIIKAKKLIALSDLLKEMKNSKYKKNLFSHKQENNSYSKNYIMACSIIYEEIFNTTINNSQLPLRENLPQLEDIFYNNTNKFDKIISLLVNLTNNNCTILRAGKDLFFYNNKYLFDLFPLIFKEYQINLFMKTIFDNFDININKELYNKKESQENKEILKSLKTKKLSKNNKNKNKTEYVEIKVIICETISSKIYYKLLTLKLTPLFNIDYNNYFILFDGLVNVHKNSVITLKDYEESNNPIEKILAVSEPELEEFPEIYSMIFQKYVTWQSNRGLVVTKLSSLKLSHKLYNIYSFLPKDKEAAKKKLKRNSQLGVEEDKKNSIRNTKIEKMIEDNASVASQQTLTNYNSGISGLGIKNKKRDEIKEYNNLNKIRKIMNISLPIIFIFLIIEFIYLKILHSNSSNNNYSFIQFRDFYSLYFQLFTSVLGIACIKTGTGCKNMISIYSKLYNENYAKKNGYFDFFLFIKGQNQILAKIIMEKRNNLLNIHNNIGDKNYNEIFGQTIDYFHISQQFLKGDIGFTLTNVTIEFSEALLIICNSFQIICNNTSDDSIYLLNKMDDPFSIINLNKNDGQELNQYQKEIYEMILNFKGYRNQFNNINKQLFFLFSEKESLIKILVILCLSLNTLVLILISLLIYVYLLFFENILIKILNYVNMTINIKNDDFSFSETFSQKINNLEIILEIYNGDPIKAVQELNGIYNEYQQYLNTKNKNNMNNMNKNRKVSSIENKKREIDDIPKNQRIVEKKDLKELKIINNYFLSLIILIIYFLGSFGFMIYLWIIHFNRNDNIFSFIHKNIFLESGLYSAINIYDLMIFHNYTIEELSQSIFSQSDTDKDKNIINKNTLLKSFYEDLKYAFNNKKEIKKLNKLFPDLEDTFNYTCENIFEMNKEKLTLLKTNPLIQQINNVEEGLINICKNMRIDESGDIVAAYEYHFQNIKNEIITINDFSYEGLIEKINNGMLGKITSFFDCVIIYVLFLTIKSPHEIGIDKQLYYLNRNITITGLLFIGIDFVIIIIVFFLYIINIKNYCSQIFLLKKVFKIYEIQEQ